MNAGFVRLQGRYFTGRQPIGLEAVLFLTGTEASLVGEEVDETHPVPLLSVSPRVGRTDRFITLPNGRQFQCADHPFLDRLPQESASEGIVAWLEARVGVAVAGVAIVAALLVAGYVWGLPASAVRIAAYVPVETERELGIQVLRWLDKHGWLTPTRIDTMKQMSIRKDFDELRRGLQYEDLFRLEFRNSRFLGANALAFPGGTVLVTDEMVNKAASPDEIAAVLAHEIGHVQQRHMIRLVLQDSAVALAAAAITGDAATLSVAVSGLPALLVQAKYSREFEEEADEFAFQLLRRRGRSPEAFATLMERLAGKDADMERSLGFLSTHPVTADRVQRARAAAQE